MEKCCTEIFVLSLIVLGNIAFTNSSNKCILPSERRLKSASAFPIGKERWRTNVDISSIPENVLQAEKSLNRIRLGIAKQIKNALRRARRHCSQNGHPLTSTFKGFTIANFKKTNLCDGSWDTRTFPLNYIDSNTGWLCWTFRNFALLKCPTYNCNNGQCKVDKTNPTSGGTRVEYSCQISNFIDIPFYVYCFPEKGVGFEYKRQVMTLSTCCNCVKLECNE